MRRYPIRNPDSPKPVKPRVFDFVVEDDNEIYIEVKPPKGPCERVKMIHVLDQVKELMLNGDCTPPDEP